MKTETKPLLEILNQLKKAVSSKDIFEQGKAFYFTGNHIMTYNDQIGIFYPFESDISFMVPAEEFLKILSKARTKAVELSVNEGTLTIKANTLEAQLKCIEYSEITDNMASSLENIKWKKLPKDFMQGVSLTMFSTSTDMSKPHLTCLHIDEDVISSSDNLRISQYTMESKIKDSFLLPAKSASELSTFKEIHKYSLDDSWVYFLSKEGFIFCSRILNVKYPDVSSFFEVEGDIVNFPKAVREVISSAEILASGEYDFDKHIQVDIYPEKIDCHGVQEKGKIKDSVEFEQVIIEPFSFCINPGFFDKILTICTEAVYSQTTILFDNEKFKHIICLFHPDSEED